MKFAYTLSGGQTFIKKLPLYGGGTAIAVDCGVMKGVTGGTNDGFYIVGAPAYAGFAGVTAQPDTDGAVSGADTKEDGTAYKRYRVIVNPDAVWRAEHSDPVTAAIAVASTSGATAGATITITSLFNHIGGSWLWANFTGVLGAGEIQYITNDNNTGSAIIKSAQSTAWTNATKVAIINRLGIILTDLDTACLKIKNPVGTPSGKVITFENYIQQKPNARIEVLDPTKHSGVPLDNTFAKMFSDIIFQNHAFANIGAS